MENLKIRVTTAQESKEAQELFFELGWQWKNSGKVILEYDPNMPFFYLDGEILHKGASIENYQVCDRKEITMQELRDMVVLKRNDPKDATHKCLWDVNPEYYTDSKGSVYFYKKELDASCWVKTVNSKDWCDKNLKLIKDEAMKESLNDKIATAEVARQELKGVDNVNNPSHYNKGGIECIDAIQSSMTKEAFCGYLKGNVQKYMWRYESKGHVESLQKAQWYLNKLIELEAS